MIYKVNIIKKIQNYERKSHYDIKKVNYETLSHNYANESQIMR